MSKSTLTLNKQQAAQAAEPAAEEQAAPPAAEPAAEEQAAAEGEVAKAFVVTCNGVDRLLHQHTSVWITKDPKKIEIDDFVSSQIAAGKVEIVTP